MKRTSRLRWRLGGVMILLCMFFTRPCLAQEQTLLLEVSVDGRATHKVIEFIQRNDTLLAHAGDLREIGLLIPGTTDVLTDLHTLPHMAWRIDTQAQVLYLTTDLRHTRATRLSVEGGPKQKPITTYGVQLA